MTTAYTASGARRVGDEYQDLQSAEVLVEWLEQPDAYHWVRLETMEGSLDDIQAERADGTLRLLQVKFATDAAVEWDWDDLTKQESGKTSPKPSLLQKWKTSLAAKVASGVTVSEAAFLTNRGASATIRAHLDAAGLVKFSELSDSLQATIATHLGGANEAAKFFASFRFLFKRPSFDALDAAIRQRFLCLGGTKDGWENLIEKIRFWINRQNEPTPGGKIALSDVRAAALWHLPPPIPQGFLVPEDYVVPKAWSDTAVVPRLRVGGDRLVVVTGSPGVGKSTYLSWLVGELRVSNIPVVRHHYFLSTTDATPYRTDWETAADAIIGQLRAFHSDLVRAVEYKNAVPEMVRDFLGAAGQERAGKHPLVVMIDGLDHVWRDSGSSESLRRLFDLLLPVPDGVVIVIGTQDIEVSKIPSKLRNLCPHDHWLRIPYLDRTGVQEWLEHHIDDLGLPADAGQSKMVFGALPDAFLDVSGGHPLILHYALNIARRGGRPVLADQVRALPIFDPSSSVATYYQALWTDINTEGHQLLHLLAGFRWAWPRDGLVQCLTPQADFSRLEQAEQAIRHVLGSSRVGVTAFHESLLAFIRALPEHQVAVGLMRPRVIDWLASRHAPEYWRWRHEWEERASNGEIEPLILSPNLDWCVSSLVAGRGRAEIAEVEVASGWCALRAGRLGIATERHYIDASLNNAGHAEGVLSCLVWLAFVGRTGSARDLELNLFLSRKAQSTEEEIEAVAERAFAAGQLDVCHELLDECFERWNAAVKQTHQSLDTFSSLERILPSLIAASIRDPSVGPYQHYHQQHRNAPRWCQNRHYAKALGRHCVVGGDTSSIRKELQFLANGPDGVSFEAVDEIIRLACREGFDANGWILNPDARRSGLARCYQWWVRKVSNVPVDMPREVSFHPVWEPRLGRDENAFVELARSYFFSCLASAVEDKQPVEPAGLPVEASKVATFLFVLRDLASTAAVAKKTGHAIGGAWLINQLSGIERPVVEFSDYNNDMASAKPAAHIMVAIAQDLELLHIAETNNHSLTPDVIKTAIDSGWTPEYVWIEDRVDRRLTMGDPQVARLLIDRVRGRLDTTRDNLHTRAKDYASLAQFCLLHHGLTDEVRDLSRLAARNLLGHGYHKDIVFTDILDALHAAPLVEKDISLRRLQAITSVIRVVDEITDGSETRHLKRQLAEIVGKIAPDGLPPYLRALQHDHQHHDVESCFTDLAESLALATVYEKALATTFVHEEALIALQKRGDGGDTEAMGVLAHTLQYCGRQTTDSPKQYTTPPIPAVTTDYALPQIADYPPERLSDFVHEVRKAQFFGDEHLVAWTTHWRQKEPDKLLAAFSAYRTAHGQPPETQTAQAVVELANERFGRDAAWEWIIIYHGASYGWSSYSFELRAVEWIWELVRTRFKDRWLDFIIATSRLRWKTTVNTPSWNIERMVRFLAKIGKMDRLNEVLDAATQWGSGLAANMRLPEPALTPDEPELPAPLRMLVDRLDSPSRVVQDRAAWALAGLLADAGTCAFASKALLEWHARAELEFRSCILLLILHLARVAHGVSVGTCLDIVRSANLVPSIGSELLLREFGNGGAVLAAALNYATRHSGSPAADFSDIKDFKQTVGAHLAPVFCTWAILLDRSGIAFLRQWEWETSKLALQQGLSLELNAHPSLHYRGGFEGPMLEVHDRVSVVLRSAYLRALHRFLDAAAIRAAEAEVHARWVGVMSDPVVWGVRPSKRPDWWPRDPGNTDGVDTLSDAVAQAVKTRVKLAASTGEEVLVYAAGPVGNRSHLRASVEMRAFLQSAHGPATPSPEALADIPETSCRAASTRMSLSGAYAPLGAFAGQIGGWAMAPLAWQFLPDVWNWIQVERQVRGLYLPATWLFPSAPTVSTEREQVVVTLGDQRVARYHYWNDELRERHYRTADPRVGCELLVNRKWLEPQIAAGASLCWVVTLSIAQRTEHKDMFGEPQVVGAWTFGGNGIIGLNPWLPPTH